MPVADIAAALQRVTTVLNKRPSAGLGADTPACARWDGDLRVRVQHDNGTQVITDLPAEVGGGGAGVAPGWLLRAALASCAVTRIAMLAAAEGILLHTLEARATSRSDARGLLGVPDVDGSAVRPEPGDVQLHVCIGAEGVSAERLRALVDKSAPQSPVTCALQSPVAVAMHVEVAGG